MFTQIRKIKNKIQNKSKQGAGHYSVISGDTSVPPAKQWNTWLCDGASSCIKIKTIVDAADESVFQKVAGVSLQSGSSLLCVQQDKLSLKTSQLLIFWEVRLHGLLGLILTLQPVIFVKFCFLTLANSLRRLHFVLLENPDRWEDSRSSGKLWHWWFYAQVFFCYPTAYYWQIV